MNPLLAKVISLFVPAMPPFENLTMGATGTRVQALQIKLKAQGFFKGEPLGNYLEKTKAAVVAFQQTHLGPDNRPLTVTGDYDRSTDWALNAPVGIEQRQHIAPLIPSGIGGDRLRVLEKAVEELQFGVVEKPDGSNDGPHIKDYLRYMGIEPAPWCASFVCWLIGTTMTRLPWDKLGDRTKYASVATLWRTCKGLGWTKGAMVVPAPGDLFVMLHDGGTGHVGMVLRVDQARHLCEVIEGNSGNRVALRTREWGKSDHVGWISWTEPPTGVWEHGLSDKGKAAAGISDR
jgi:hypothetical protein